MDYLSALDFWGLENPENPYKQLMQVLLHQADPQSNQSGVNMGRDVLSQGGRMGAGQFAPGSISTSGGLPDWLTNPNLPPGMTMGSETGLNIAENADWIGRGVGALTGLPGMSLLAQALASRYFDNNVFMSPAETTSDIDQAINEMLYGAMPQQSPGYVNVNNFNQGRIVPGSGSRMSPSSNFIWSMGGVNAEPRKLNLNTPGTGK